MPHLVYDENHWRALIGVMIERIGLARFVELVAEAVREGDRDEEVETLKALREALSEAR